MTFTRITTIALTLIAIATFVADAHAKDVVIEKIHCKDGTESGADEFYFKVIADGRTSKTGQYKLKNGQAKTVNKTFTFYQAIRIQVWEADGSSGDDYIGTMTLSINAPNQPARWRLSGSSTEVYITLRPKESITY